MGKEYIIQLILKKTREERSAGIGLVVVSILLGLFAYFFIDGWEGDFRFVFLGVVLLFICVIGILLIVKSTEALRDPYSSAELINNPELFRQAEDLLAKEIYRDRYLIVSEQVIANAQNPLEMIYRDEVFLIYIYSVEDYGAKRASCLHLQTARGLISISIEKLPAYEVDELINQICRFCKYAKVGYTSEGLDYLETMRIRWKNDRSRKQGEESC